MPESSWWKTPLQEHNNGLQCFPSAEGERPVTARAAWSGLNNVSIYSHHRHHKTAPIQQILIKAIFLRCQTPDGKLKPDKAPDVTTAP